MLYQNKNNVYYLGVDTYVKLLLDCVELLNLMKNKNINYIISSDLNLENRLNYSRLRQNKDSDKFSTCKATSIQSKINKANNYYRGGYISIHIPSLVKSIIATSINLL